MTRFWVALLLASLPLAQLPVQPLPPSQPPSTQRPGDVARAAAPVRTGVIRGRVIATNGRPLRRANVTLTAEPAGQRRVTSGPDGSFEFRDLDANSYRLAAAKPGYLQMEYGQQRAFERGKLVALGNGEILDGLDVRLVPAGAVSGRILDEYGDPIEGAGVQLLQKRFTGGRQTLTGVFGNVGTAVFLTNDAGMYRVFGVPQGEYLVLCVPVPAPGLATTGLPGYAPTLYPGVPTASGAQWLTVGSGQEVAGIDFNLQPARTARISGVALRANGSPLQFVITMNANQRTGAVPIRFTATPAIDGRFEFRHIPPGDYILQTVSQEGESLSQRLIVEGTDITDLALRTGLTSAVAGEVVFEGIGPAPAIAPNRVVVSSVLVNADVIPQAPAPATVDAARKFQFQGLSGSRLFRIERAPSGWMLKAVRYNGTDITDSPVSLGSRQQSMSGLEIVLTNRLTAIGGSVTDSRGTPAADYSVVAFATDRERWGEGTRFLKLARPVRDGTFSLMDLPPGEYYVAAVDHLQGTESGGEWQDPEVLESIAQRATRVTLAEGQQLSTALRLIVR